MTYFHLLFGQVAFARSKDRHELLASSKYRGLLHVVLAMGCCRTRKDVMSVHSSSGFLETKVAVTQCLLSARVYLAACAEVPVGLGRVADTLCKMISWNQMYTEGWPNSVRNRRDAMAPNQGVVAQNLRDTFV